MKDYFNILGVDASASNDQIRSAYKKLAMQHHPDRGGDQIRFQEIQEAYNVLSDNDKRAQYEHQKNFQNSGNFHFNFSFGDGNIHDIFRQFHNGGPFGHFRHVQKNRDIKAVIEIDLARTLEHTVEHIDIPNHTGGKNTVQVNIPRGVQTGMQMRFPGLGDKTITTVAPGDLFVEFRVRAARDFTVDHLNLIKIQTINCVDAIAGCDLMVFGLDKKQFQLTVPPGTQPNTKLRIPQQGLWDINHPVRGDLFIEIHIEIPRTLTQEQLRKLAAVLQ